MSTAAGFSEMLRSERVTVTLTHGVIPRSEPMLVERWTVEREGDIEVVSGEVTFGPFGDAVDFDAVSVMLAGQPDTIRFAEAGRLPPATPFIYTLAYRIGRM